MTFLATLVVFTVALSLVWLATHRTGGQHECSCSRSRRVLAEYERVHSRACRGTRSVLIPSSEIARKPSKSV